ncbi:MAG: glycosyltransferase [Candidatus Moranbacteria bacterium]|jgi:glycosyltransferase involved in cell wall biosynthesis|nr:glycosyltransferase [Candidatus Moranbacteria bacterium]
MNIAIFTNNYLPNPYGVTTSVESFRREFEKRGHNVYIFAPYNIGYKDKNKNVFRYPSIDIKYKIRFPLPIPYSRKIDREIKKLKIDIIHSQHPNLLGWVAINWAEKKNVPLVFTWHTIYDQYTHYTPFIPKQLAKGWVINNSVNYANCTDKIIIPTISVKKIIENWGVNNENIEVIPTGVDIKMFSNVNSVRIKEELAIDDDKKIILSISRLTEEKNVIFLVKEVIKVLKKDPDAVFILGGDGYLKNDLIKIINKAKVGKQVFLVGLVDKEEVKNYLNLADVFVYASKSETQGTIITEAMYMGLPIVALKALGVSDLITSGKTGILVSTKERNFDDNIFKLLSDKGLAKYLGENAQKEAREKYTSEVCAGKMLEIYEELINKN